VTAMTLFFIWRARISGVEVATVIAGPWESPGPGSTGNHRGYSVNRSRLRSFFPSVPRGGGTHSGIHLDWERKALSNPIHSIHTGHRGRSSLAGRDPEPQDHRRDPPTTSDRVQPARSVVGVALRLGHEPGTRLASTKCCEPTRASERSMTGGAGRCSGRLGGGRSE